MTGKRNTSGLKPWPKGVSGNPGGRPKKLPITDVLLALLDSSCKADVKARSFGELIGLALVKKAVKGDVRAITEIIDRAEGKPRQRIEQSGPDGGPIPYDIPDTREEVERQLAELIGAPIGSDTTQSGKPARRKKA